ncbi:tetratricopeptide repeat protein [Spongiivirga citrea]|uniref:Tetratricopeptide repeat protein n=1 Tax=Spongiivirga citrea TaxID=1481457 RepID=A0A6M0CNY3_9FLAO|nr:tetratricopeptide repeat protein [Spongiivirga citrea]NER15640.1 tetratricopeptide repeat protein [Spongiivirga citrea]
MKCFRLLFVLILFLLTHVSFSQNDKKIDSLTIELKNATQDSIRLKIFEKLFSEEIYSNPTNAKKHATQAMNIAKKIGKENSYNQAIYAIGNYYFIVQEQDSSKYYYQKALRLAEKNNDLAMIAKSISSLALMERDQNKAIKMRDSAGQIYLELKNYLNYAINIGAKAQLINNMGDHTEAYRQSLEALRILDTIDSEPYRKADINVQLAKIEEKRNNRKEAIKYYEDALEIYLKTDDFVYQSNAYVEIGFTYFNEKQYDEAIINLEKGLQLAKKFKLKNNYSRALAYLGVSHLHKNSYEKAREYLKAGIEFDNRLKRNGPSTFKLIHLARLESSVNNYSKSLKYFNEALQMALVSSNKRLERDIYRSRSFTYEEMGNYKMALKESKLYIKLRDSIQKAYKNQEIEDLKIKYQTEKKEAALALQKEEIKTLNEKAKVDRLNKTLYAGGAVGGVLLSGLLFFGFRQRMKKNKIEREKQEEIYKQEIEFKKKELASQTLHLVQKNSFLTELKENLENLKNSPDKFKMEFKRLVMLLKKESSGDKDWEVFKSYFAEVHDNFDNKLKSVYADISEKEIRLASFLKMNLSTKEIADMLNVLPDSVLKSKYRLKKKLNLDKETDLYQYLSSL